ncbi:MAG: V-type proton ATPase subunit E [Firmicutes bacterium]|nr:V-type proton ATPase subunit E [Bacillota bacterium]
MSIEKILAKILGDAEKQVQAIYAAGYANEEARLAAAKQQAVAQGEGIITGAEARVVEEEARLLTAARLDARKKLLAVKQSVMEEAFAKALAALRALPVHEQRQLLKAMILSAVETGEEKVACAREDSQVFQPAFLEEVNAALTATGRRGQLTLSAEHLPTGGGFYLLGESLEINVTYPILLKSVREQLEPEVATVLFS